MPHSHNTSVMLPINKQFQLTLPVLLSILYLFSLLLIPLVLKSFINNSPVPSARSLAWPRMLSPLSLSGSLGCPMAVQVKWHQSASSPTHQSHYWLATPFMHLKCSSSNHILYPRGLLYWHQQQCMELVHLQCILSHKAAISTSLENCLLFQLIILLKG